MIGPQQWERQRPVRLVDIVAECEPCRGADSGMKGVSSPDIDSQVIDAPEAQTDDRTLNSHCERKCDS